MVFGKWGPVRLSGAVAAAAVLVVAGCSGGSDTPDIDSAVASTAGDVVTPEVSESPTEEEEALPEQCGELTDPPEEGGVIVFGERADYKPIFAEYDVGVIFEATFKNTSDLVAIDVEADYRFFIDGEEVTGELKRDSIIQYRPLHIEWLTWNTPGTDRPVVYPRGDDADAPAHWEGAEIELRVDVTVGGWCTPAADVAP